MMQRETINVIELGIGLCFLFSAALTHACTVQTVLSSRHEEDKNIPQHAGYYSSTISLGAYTITNFFSAPFVLFFHPKRCLILSSAGYTIHMLGFLFLNKNFLYFSSTLQGMCAAITWTSSGMILAKNSNGNNISRNSGIMWILFMSSLVLGGSFLLVLFSISHESRISLELTKRIHLGFAFFCVCAGVTFALIKTNPSADSEKTDAWTEMKKSICLMITPDMALLFPLFIFIGLESALFSAVYSTAIVNTTSFHVNPNILMASYTIVVGIGQIIAGIPIILLGHRVYRNGISSLILIACFTGCIAFFLAFINIPSNASFKKTNETALINPSITIALLTGFLMGMCDSFANIGLYSFISVHFAKNSAQANSIMKFVCALPNIMGVYGASLLKLHWLLATAGIAAIFGLISFVMAEKRVKEQH